MTELILHAITRGHLERYAAATAHALLLVAPAGAGKGSVAQYLACQVLGISEAEYAQHPYIKTLSSEAGAAITIESVRELQHFLSLRVPGKDGINRAIIIENAPQLTTEAQNALLKTLEEPPADTILILTAASQEGLLPTVRSRTRMITILAPDPSELTACFEKQGYDAAAISKAMMVSGELPGLTAALLQDNTAHPLVEATTYARGILQSKTYERLLLVDTLSKQKQLCLDMLYVLGQMSRIAMLRSTDKQTGKRWLDIMKASQTATEQLRANVQAKLVLTNFMLVLA